MKILLACSSGMSTSLMVNKMKAAAEAQGLDDEIWAVGQSEVDNNLEKCDVLLVGPQMRMLKAKIEGKAGEMGVPVEIIPPQVYGMVDGEKVLAMAHELAG